VKPILQQRTYDVIKTLTQTYMVTAV